MTVMFPEHSGRPRGKCDIAVPVENANRQKGAAIANGRSMCTRTKTARGRLGAAARRCTSVHCALKAACLMWWRWVKQAAATPKPGLRRPPPWVKAGRAVLVEWRRHIKRGRKKNQRRLVARNETAKTDGWSGLMPQRRRKREKRTEKNDTPGGPTVDPAAAAAA